MEHQKLWGGRFSKETDALVDDFNSSIHFDYKMYRQDIRGSMAHAKMLGKCGIIPEADAALIVKTLGEILEDIEQGKVTFSVEAEDIHMNIETLLIERIGEVGKRLHTGRSRNDQVALDLRMYLMDQEQELSGLLVDLLHTLLRLAKEHQTAIMPGYTHLQKAQPIHFGHHMMAYFEMFRRDLERLEDCKKRTNSMPLGSGALAGTTYPLDRCMVAEELGFSGITRNSLDGVSDRDFALELAFVLSVIMVHISRFAEEIILWNTGEFSFVEMDDAYSTGSSIMPQKKNPDVAELARGKSGRVFGDLMGLLTVMKGLPLAYNKDMQEDKEQIFDAVDTVKMVLKVFRKMLDTMKVKTDEMLLKSRLGFTNATDAADYLVKKGIPFRDAHSMIGHMVAYAISHQKALDDFTMEEFHQFSPIIEPDIYQAISVQTCVQERKLPGAPGASAQAIAEAEEFLAAYTWK